MGLIGFSEKRRITWQAQERPQPPGLSARGVNVDEAISKIRAPGRKNAALFLFNNPPAIDPCMNLQ
jgi:hypothetical protein